MEVYDCPICGSKECTTQETPDYYTLFRCPEGHIYAIQNDIFNLAEDMQNKIFNLIFEILLKNSQCNKNYWYFSYSPNGQHQNDDKPERLNIADLIQAYPSTIFERTDRSLINLSRLYPQYGMMVEPDIMGMRAVFGEDGNEDALSETIGFFELLIEMGYLSYGRDTENLYKVSANGWKRIEELSKRQYEIRQGFIAMSFRAETKNIREAFRKAISNAGYAVSIIDEKEHNNQIVPEIFYEIEKSKFVVVDVSYPNYGAYYEAGYALGAGKQVIVCCKKDFFENADGQHERPHFDISQKSLVIWENEDDLVNRLEKRIEATVK